MSSIHRHFLYPFLLVLTRRLDIDLTGMEEEEDPLDGTRQKTEKEEERISSHGDFSKK